MLKLAASVLALIAAVAAVLWISRSLNDSPEEEAYGYFLRDVATVEAMGLQVYWLGREFAVDSLMFRGPYGFEFSAEVEGVGIEMTYLASLGRGSTGLDLDVYSRDVWELTKDRVLNPGLPGVTHRAITVGGREAELILVPLGTRPLNTLWLLLDLGDVVVLAETSSLIAPAAEGAVELNPIIKNPDLLLQVMENLRPYPE
jgi:hypothetical protein